MRTTDAQGRAVLPATLRVLCLSCAIDCPHLAPTCLVDVTIAGGQISMVIPAKTPVGLAAPIHTDGDGDRPMERRGLFTTPLVADADGTVTVRCHRCDSKPRLGSAKLVKPVRVAADQGT